MYEAWLSVRLSIDYTRKSFPTDLKFWIYREFAKFGIMIGLMYEVWLSVRLSVVKVIQPT